MRLLGAQKAYALIGSSLLCCNWMYHELVSIRKDLSQLYLLPMSWTILGDLSTRCQNFGILKMACTACRAKRAEEALEQARTEAEKASQRAASAEVKLQVLQQAVQQAEERAATLEMQVSPGSQNPD